MKCAVPIVFQMQIILPALGAKMTRELIRELIARPLSVYRFHSSAENQDKSGIERRGGAKAVDLLHTQTPTVTDVSIYRIGKSKGETKRFAVAAQGASIFSLVMILVLAIVGNVRPALRRDQMEWGA